MDCGYYFFRSDGTRVKNKWDKMDFDALLAEADSGDEGSGSKVAATASAAPSKHSPQRVAQQVVQEAKAVAHRLEKVTALVDQVRLLHVHVVRGGRGGARGGRHAGVADVGWSRVGSGARRRGGEGSTALTR